MFIFSTLGDKNCATFFISWLVVILKYVPQFCCYSNCLSTKVSIQRDELVAMETEKKAKAKPSANVANYHKLEYLTTEQFDNVPK